jgi:hypothetical protein
MKLFIPLAALALGACQVTATVPPASPTPIVQLETIGEGDLHTATTLGNAAGDANGPRCWTYLSALIPAIQAPATIGVATGIEIARLAQLPAYAEACGPLGLLTGQPAAFALPKP